MSKVIIGSARIGENGKITGGKAGDQKQTSTIDYRGEVSLQDFYVHSKGWMIARPKDVKKADKIASNMKYACSNKHLGYNQGNRYGVIMYGIHTKKNTNCDCTSLARACIREAYNIDPGDFTTANEMIVLKKTGLFDIFEYKKGAELYPGDILCTKTKGHTVIVVEGYDRNDNKAKKKSVSDIAKEVIAGKWGTGEERKKKLQDAGYNYTKVQAKVNELLKGE